MNLLTSLRIGRRLGLAFAISIAFTVLLAAYARTALVGINDELHVMVDDRMVKVAQLEQIKDNVNINALAVRNVLLLADAEGKRKQLADVDAAAKRTADLFDKLEASVAPGPTRDVAVASTPHANTLHRVGVGSPMTSAESSHGERFGSANACRCQRTETRTTRTTRDVSKGHANRGTSSRSVRERGS